MRQYKGIVIDQVTGATRYTKWCWSWREACDKASKLAKKWHFQRFIVGVM